MGETDKFIINGNQELQLNDDAAGSSIIYLSYPAEEEMQWDIYFRMNFNPSASNRLRIYLAAHDSNLTESDAFFLDIGENGNDVPIYLVRRTDGTDEILLTMETGAVAFDPAQARVKVTYHGDGEWELWADYEGEQLFPDRRSVEGAFLDTGDYFFGLHCSYTVTRATLFFFDDLRIGTPLPDTTTMEISDIRVLSPDGIQVRLSKLPDANSVIEEENYFIPGIGNPNQIIYDGEGSNRIELYFEEEFVNGENYLLELIGLEDLSGNLSFDQKEFTFILPEIALPGDVVINEIHSLPSANTLMPQIKFIELYNPSDKFIDLTGLTFSDRTRTATLNEEILSPGEFLLLASTDDIGQLESYGRTMGLDNFPVINNNNDDIELRSASNELLFAVSYRPNWFDDAVKAEGGYSLELINPNILCSSRDNWRLSNNASGGSPGMVNSVFDPSFTPGAPELTYGSFSNAGQLTLVFDKELDWIAGMNISAISIDGLAGDAQASIDPRAPFELGISTQEAWQDDVFYQIAIEGLRSCAGDATFGNINYSFKVPVSANAGELVINELLYHPPVGVRDFIELNNVSEENYFRLSDLLFYHKRSNETEVVLRPTSDRIIQTGDLLTIGRETELISTAYEVENPRWLHTLDLFSIDNNSGSLVLSAFHDDEVKVLDSISYSSDLHDPLLRNTRGISLERTDPDLNGGFAAAWYSASTLSGGATPTAQNSQRRIVAEAESKDFFFLPTRTFSPNGDGFEDFLQLEYRIDDPGYVASIRIFDMNGRLVRNLVRNESLGTNGVILWSGENDNGEKANIGIYVILIELHNINGDRKKERLTAVLADRLN